MILLSSLLFVLQAERIKSDPELAKLLHQNKFRKATWNNYGKQYCIYLWLTKKIKMDINMIRKYLDTEVNIICEIINDASVAYKGIIPVDRWKEPYMPIDELKHEIADGVVFYCYEEEGVIIGVMGIQDVQDAKLIRHAYVRTTKRKSGIGTKLLNFLTSDQDKPILIGTWKDAKWAIDFYLKNGFCEVTEEEKNVLLKKYWNIPERQVETSTVLINTKLLMI